MFDQNAYVPILKWKAGEYKAINRLDARIKNKIFPLIEIIPIPIDLDTEEPTKSVEEHLEGIAGKIEKFLGKGMPIFLDLDYLDDDVASDGRHPLGYVFDDIRAKNLKAIPVTGLDRSKAYQTAIKGIVEKDKHGVCIRLTKENFEEDIDFKNALDKLLKELYVSSSDTDIVIDYESIPPSAEDEAIYSLSIKELIKDFPDILKWRTFTFAGSSFPKDLSEVRADDVSNIRRVEWNIWKALAKAKDNNKIKRLPTFGDYGIAHPELPFADFRIMKMSANIRYTSDNDWLILKGRNTRRHGFDQFRDLSEACLNSSEFKGKDYSWGDNYIYKCAQKPPQVGTGNPTTWREVGNSHHLTFVVNQISNFFGI
jgi:hypothetical protein